MLGQLKEIPCYCPHCTRFLHEKYCFSLRYGSVKNSYTDHLSPVNFPKRSSLRDARIPNRST
ncbi:unnamed protein product, partial [Heterobilharzia americana]